MLRFLTIVTLTGAFGTATAFSEEKPGETGGFVDNAKALQSDGWTPKAAHLDHLRRAVEHLEAAGLTKFAAKVEELAETEVLRVELAQKRKELRKINDDIQRLERLLNSGQERASRQTGKQVLTRVKIMKLDLGKLNQWGLNVGKDGLGGILFGSPADNSDRTLKARSLKEESVVKLLDWLCENKVAKIVAEPVLVTTSGTPASFFSGGQVPVITRDGEQYSINYRNIGTQLQLVPTLTGDKIHLEIRPTISRVVSAAFEERLEGEESNYESRSFSAEIDVQSGQTAAIGGLTEADEPDAAEPRRLPQAKGAESESRDSSKCSEYIFLITPQIVESQVQNARPEFIEPVTVPRAFPKPDKDLEKNSSK